MIKILIIAFAAATGFCPAIARALTFDDMLVHHPSKTQPFMGDQKNIKWQSHTPDILEDPEEQKALEESVTGPSAEADYRGQVDIGEVDVDGDSVAETIKAIWGPGVSDHSLALELYRGTVMLGRFKPNGIQANYKLEDMDGDGKLEIILWGAVYDPNMSQLLSDESKPFEGHSDPHLFEVSVYKLGKGGYELSQNYRSKNKYEPFCEEMPM